MIPGLSLPEIRALCTKAARGAGYSWGLAEEAGMAAQWLEARGWPGAFLVAQLLETGEAYGLPAPPDPAQPGWGAEATPLCPLTTGAYLSDTARADALDLSVVASPALLAPFLGPTALFRAGWSGAWIAIDADALFGQGDALLAPVAGPVSLTSAGHPGTLHAPGGPAAPRDVHDSLTRFAGRTYVPESDESRSRGAGDGA